MNKRIKELSISADKYANDICDADVDADWYDTRDEKFARLIVKECADICMEMSAKCAGLEGDGALAKDCAFWIKKDFGVEG